MYKVIFSKETHDALALYFTQYKKYYIDRFSDTGIQDEYLIQLKYLKLAKNLSNTIFTSLDTVFAQDIIYGRHVHEDNPNKFTLIRTIKDRTLIIEYTEDTTGNSRIVESLRIMRE